MYSYKESTETLVLRSIEKYGFRNAWKNAKNVKLG